jgi:uncharacterized protein DUF4129
VAAVAVLLAVAATGLRARGTFSHGSDRTASGFSGSVLAIALSAAEALAIIAFVIVLASARPQRKPKRDEDDEEPWRPVIPWWTKAVAVLLAVAAIITPLAVLLTRKPRHQVTLPLTSASRPRLGTPAVASSAAIWPLITGMAIAIALVVVLTWLYRPRRAARTVPERRKRLARLAGSLAAGSDALTAGGEPRTAIIACYAAMERGFADAGSAPAAADTPAEVLVRATRAGLVRPAPAEALTGLFRRARYSTYPMTSADSRLAAAALTEMRSDLARTEAAP